MTGGSIDAVVQDVSDARETTADSAESGDGATQPVTVEYVCTGNTGRSPMAELIANDYARAASIQVRATSSGSKVDDIRQGNTSYTAKQKFVGRAVRRAERGELDGVFDDEERVLAAYVAQKDELDAEDKAFLDELFERSGGVHETFRNEELSHRAVMARELYDTCGIEGRIKNAHEQTRATSDVDVVLPMAERNKQAVVEIYENSDVATPPIANLHDYVEADAPVADAFGQGAEAYRNAVAMLLKYVPESVDRAAERAR